MKILMSAIFGVSLMLPLGCHSGEVDGCDKKMNYDLENVKGNMVINDRLIVSFLQKFSDLSWIEGDNVLRVHDVKGSTYERQGSVFNSVCGQGFLFEYLLTKEKEILVAADISSSKFQLGSVKIGMKKENFQSVIHVNSGANVVVVEDTEGGNSLYFVFKENQLVRISYRIKYLD